MHCLVNLIQFSLIVTFTFIFKFKRETVHFWVSLLFIFLHLLDHNSYQENPILVRPLPSHLIWSIFPEIFRLCSEFPTLIYQTISHNRSVIDIIASLIHGIAGVSLYRVYGTALRFLHDSHMV